MYAVVDLANKGSRNQVSSKNKNTDIPMYHEIELIGDRSHKETDNSHQQLSNNPLYSEIEYSKNNQKSITTRNKLTSPQQIPMSSLNHSDGSVAASDEKRNKKANLNCFMLLIIILLILLIITAVTALTAITFLRLSTIEADLNCIDSEIQALHMTFLSEIAKIELKNDIHHTAISNFNETLLKLYKDVQDVNNNISSILTTFPKFHLLLMLRNWKKVKFF